MAEGQPRLSPLLLRGRGGVRGKGARAFSAGGQVLSGAVVLQHAEVTQGWRRRGMFEWSDDYETFLSILAGAHGRTSMRTIDYCVMPNHPTPPRLRRGRLAPAALPARRRGPVGVHAMAEGNAHATGGASHGTAGGHILGAALRVAPVPAAAKLLAELRPAPVPVFSQEISNQPDVLGTQFPSLDDYDACHGSHGMEYLRPSSARILAFFCCPGRGGGDVILRLLVASW